MFGSEALETAIGLALMLFVVATAASALLEAVSRVLGKRADNLERAIEAMLTGTDPSDADVTAAMNAFKGTTIYQSVQQASGTTLFKKEWKRPSYLSAKSFADAVAELGSFTDQVAALKSNTAIPAALRKRITEIVDSGASSAKEVKAELEKWFDNVMERVSGAYKRWSTIFLFGFGLLIAISANASVVHVGEELWNDAPLRAAVADSADTVIVNGAESLNVSSVAATEEQLAELHLPIGWDADARAEWHDRNWQVWKWTGNQFALLGGWFATALLVMFGAPFWFDVLTKAVSLRTSGAKPKPAHEDVTSATYSTSPALSVRVDDNT